jgi:hypothetical protein
VVSRGYGKRTRGVKVDLVFEKVRAKKLLKIAGQRLMALEIQTQ